MGRISICITNNMWNSALYDNDICGKDGYVSVDIKGIIANNIKT